MVVSVWGLFVLVSLWQRLRRMFSESILIVVAMDTLTQTCHISPCTSSWKCGRKDPSAPHQDSLQHTLDPHQTIFIFNKEKKRILLSSACERQTVKGRAHVINTLIIYGEFEIIVEKDLWFILCWWDCWTRLRKWCGWTFKSDESLVFLNGEIKMKNDLLCSLNCCRI